MPDRRLQWGTDLEDALKEAAMRHGPGGQDECLAVTVPGRCPIDTGFLWPEVEDAEDSLYKS